MSVILQLPAYYCQMRRLRAAWSRTTPSIRLLLTTVWSWTSHQSTRCITPSHTTLVLTCQCGVFGVRPHTGRCAESLDDTVQMHVDGVVGVLTHCKYSRRSFFHFLGHLNFCQTDPVAGNCSNAMQRRNTESTLKHFSLIK